jgi:hypothetical protein
MYRARLRTGEHGAGVESLETALFSEADIPWPDIAFASVRFALESFFLDRREQRERLHFHDIQRGLR